MNHLHVQLQFFAPFFRNRCTEYAPTVRQHKIDLFRSDLFCGDNEISFVFAIFVIDDDQKFSLTKIFNCFFNRVHSVHMSRFLEYSTVHYLPGSSFVCRATAVCDDKWPADILAGRWEKANPIFSPPSGLSGNE